MEFPIFNHQPNMQVGTYYCNSTYLQTNESKSDMTRIAYYNLKYCFDAESSLAVAATEKAGINPAF